jgi:hypothetical protein
VAVLLAQVGDVRPGGFEDPQAKQPEHRDQREVASVRRLAGAVKVHHELRLRSATARA